MTPYFAIAASVSPPPASENAFEFAIACAIVFVPSPNGSNSNTPTGPFHTTVPALAMIPASARAVCGPTSRTISSAATSRAAFVTARASGASAFAHTTSTGIGTSAPRAFIASMIFFASPTRSDSTSEFPTGSPAASMKVLAMPPPTMS